LTFSLIRAGLLYVGELLYELTSPAGGEYLAFDPSYVSSSGGSTSPTID